MAEENRVVNAVNWRELFTFTHVFRAFRVAVQPSKMLLAMAALLLIYLAGRCMDWTTPAKYRVRGADVAAAAPAVPANVDPLLREFLRGADLAGGRERTANVTTSRYADRLREVNALKGNQLGLDKPEALQTAAREVKYLDDVVFMLKNQRDQRKTQRLNDFNNLKAEEKTEAAMTRRDQDIAALYAFTAREVRTYCDLNGRGLFDTFFTNERIAVYTILDGALSFDTRSAVRGLESFFLTNPRWAFSEHPVFFGIFSVIFLAIWALFGGAVTRIAAVHVARDEKISLKAALKFSIGKFLSFFFAPLIPVGIIYGIGLVVWVAALALGNIPAVGPILAGILFLLALAGGFVMALVLLGLAGGMHMMYPTIAAEGSDSFDAISRSFSYLYARPWRLLLYTTVALVYGAITFMFVRFFIGMTLSLTRYFVSNGVFLDAPNHTDWFDVAWPTSGNLTYTIDFLSLGGGQSIAAGLIAFWVYLTIALLGAFAISFYFSANTIIYFLMRREVDATELDDVYIEQAEEELTEPAAPAAPATAGTTSTPVPTTTSATAAPAPAATTTTETPAPAAPDATASTESKPPDQPAA